MARIWKAFGLHRHPTDPQFVDKVRDVVGLYMSPPNNAVVLCLNEPIGGRLPVADGPKEQMR